MTDRRRSLGVLPDRAKKTLEDRRRRLEDTLLCRIRREIRPRLLGELHEAGEEREQVPRTRRSRRRVWPCETSHPIGRLESLAELVPRALPQVQITNQIGLSVGHLRRSSSSAVAALSA